MWQSFGNWKVTVAAAFTEGSKVLPVSADRPEGMSTANMGTPEAFISKMVSATFPLTGG